MITTNITRRQGRLVPVLAKTLALAVLAVVATFPRCTNAFLLPRPTAVVQARLASTSATSPVAHLPGGRQPTAHGWSRLTNIDRGRSSFQLGMSTDATVGVEQKGLVTVYFKTTCPYCKKALALLEEEYKLDVKRVDVLGDDSEKKIKQMKTFSGRNTVPQIFFNSEHIGGNDDLQNLHEEGKLPDLVAAVRAEEPGMMKDTWYHPWY